MFLINWVEKVVYVNSIYKKEYGIFVIVCLIKVGEIKVDGG